MGGKRKELKVYIQQSRGEKYDAVWLENSVREIVGKMMSTRLANTMRITVKVRGTLCGQKKVSGSCLAVDISEIKNRKSKKYTIEVRKGMELSEVFATLAHELVHVHQYAQARLRTVKKGGRWVDTWRENGVTTVYEMGHPYHECPWEIEAYRIEREYKEEYIRTAWQRRAA